MMSNNSTNRLKTILGGVLLLSGVFLIAGEVAGAIGGYIDLERVKFYTGTDDRIRVEFEVDTTFEITYFEKWGRCYSTAYEEDWDVFSYSIHSDNFYPFSRAFFIQSLETHETCPEYSETYTAGKTYDVYLYISDDGTAYHGFVAGVPMADTDFLTDSPDCYNSICPYTATTTAYFQLNDIEYPDDYFYWEQNPNITVNYPYDGSEVSSEFTMEVDYNLVSGYERIMIIFEDWDASSTCPISGTDEWNAEKILGYFNYQSLPYFSNYFSTLSGSTTIEVDGLNSGIYNCVRCYYINESTNKISEELCPNYNLSVAVYNPPSDIPDYYLPISGWGDYYAENSEKYDVPTPLYDNLAGAFEPVINKIGGIIIFFNSYFDTELASEKGAEFGNIIPILRGYLEQFNNFFGNLPVSEFLLFYLITSILVIIYRLVKGILTIIIP